jgi:hypothetical protein
MTAATILGLREDHRSVVLRGLAHHARGGLNLWQRVFGPRDLFGKKSDSFLKRAQLPNVR